MRKVNVVASATVNKTLDGFENLDINNISSAYNCSIDVMYVGIANLLDNQQFYPILEMLIEKIKPNGQFILKIHDIKRLCNLYINNHIQEQDFFNIIRSTNNSYNLDNVCQLLESKNFHIVDIKKDEWTNQIISVKQRV